MATQITSNPQTAYDDDYYRVQREILAVWAGGAKQIAVPITDILVLGPERFEGIRANLE